LSKAEADQSDAPLGALLYVRLLAILANIRLGWESLQEDKNTLAYYELS
jgi:hypothetical protein